jgi:hypothetical protein
MAQASRAKTIVITGSATFERFAGMSGVVVGLCSLLYAVFFLLVSGTLHTYLPPIFLAIGGFLALPVVVALYGRVRGADESFALWALLLAAIGYVGTAAHAVYGLALVVPQVTPGGDTLPSQLDPRGFLAFGVPGIAVLIFAWLIARSHQFPTALAYVGYALGIAVIALFLGTLFTNDLKSLWVLVPGAAASLIATPIWNIWLGLRFLRGQ